VDVTAWCTGIRAGVVDAAVVGPGTVARTERVVEFVTRIEHLPPDRSLLRDHQCRRRNLTIDTVDRIGAEVANPRIVPDDLHGSG
jgi:hypothetical protein